MARDREELLAQIATWYYDLGKSQQEIANALDISRSNISRMLKEARARGIVEIFIHHPLRRVSRLEQQLVERFALRGAGVVEALPGDGETTLRLAAELGARLLDEALADAKVLGLSLGSAVYTTVNAFTPSARYDVEVVQLMGGGSLIESMMDGPAVVESTARRLTNRFRYLHAPVIVDSPAIARALLDQHNVAETLTLARRADVALVGIGALSPTSSSLIRARFWTPDELRMLKELGVVGDICGRYFDRTGRPAPSELNDRIIGISLEELRAIPAVIGVASSPAKKDAILGAMQGRYIDYLVTDSETADALLAVAE